MSEVTCSIVDEFRNPVYHALIIIDGAAHQLSGNTIKITTGQHKIKVMHKRFITEEGKLNVTNDFSIVLGGDTESLLK